VTEAGYGGAVLELVDAALDTLRSGAHDALAFRCGPTTVRILTSTASGFEQLPFTHLTRAAGRDRHHERHELVVHVCDGEFPGAAGRRPPRGFLRVRDHDLFVAVTDGPPMVEGLRRHDDRAMSWIDDAAQAPPYARFRPFSEIFAAWFPSVGMVLLHAAAVGDVDGVVLLVGNGGSGKSTTAVVCSQAGVGFLGDDFCVLEPGAPPRVHSIYRSAKLRDDSARRVPEVEAPPNDRVDEDHYFLVDDAIVSAPVLGVVAVRPAADPTTAPRLERVTRDAIFPTLLPTALKVATGGDAAYRTWLRVAHAIAETVPAFRLELTWDTARVVELVREALDVGRTHGAST